MVIKLKILFAFIFLFVASNVKADLIIKSSGNINSPEIQSRFECIKKRMILNLLAAKQPGEAFTAVDTKEVIQHHKARNQFEAAKAACELGDMLIDGYFPNGEQNAKDAFTYYLEAHKIFQNLLTHHHSEVDLDELVAIKFTTMERLSEFYLKRERYEAYCPKVCQIRQDELVKEMYASVIGSSSSFYTKEQLAEAYFRLAEVSESGTQEYFEYIESAMALGHARAFTLLGNYIHDKAVLMHIFVKLHTKNPDKAFQLYKTVSLNSCPERICREEAQCQIARQAAREKFGKEYKLPRMLKETPRLSQLAEIVENKDVAALQKVYFEESLDLFKQAAFLGDTQICCHESLRYLHRIGLHLLKKPDEPTGCAYDSLGFYFAFQGSKYNDEACYTLLGKCFEQGRGTPKNPDYAVDCYLLAKNGMLLEEMGILDWEQRSPQYLINFEDGFEKYALEPNLQFPRMRKIQSFNEDFCLNEDL